MKPQIPGAILPTDIVEDSRIIAYSIIVFRLACEECKSDDDDDDDEGRSA